MFGQFCHTMLWVVGTDLRRLSYIAAFLAQHFQPLEFLVLTIGLLTSFRELSLYWVAQCVRMNIPASMTLKLHLGKRTDQIRLST